MKRIFLIIILLSFISFGQSLPHYFDLDNPKSYKVTANTPASNTIEHVHIDDNGTIWLGTSRGLSKSTDNGSSWTNYYQTQDFGIKKVSKAGSHNGVIWAGLWDFVELFGESQVEGAGLRYSTDNGQTWNIIQQPVDSQNDLTVTYGINTLNALPITVAVNNMTYDIGFTSDAIWIATFAGGLRKSTDMGQTWHRVVLPPDYLDSIHPNDTLNFDLSPSAGALGFEENLNHRVFSIHVVNDNLMYAGTAAGINKSTDGGISWQKFNHQNQDQSISGNFIVELDYDYYSNTIWAATWKAVDLSEYWAVSASSNGGESWKTFLPNERVHDFGFKYSYSGESLAGSEVFAATENGVFRTSNNGTTWIANPKPIDDQTGASLLTSSFRSVETKYLSDFTTDIWLGSLRGLAKLNETRNEFWSGKWTVYIASQELSEEIKAFAFPNPFAPDRSKVTIQYTIGNNDADVTIRIFDFGMNLVRTVIQNAPRFGGIEQRELWDGRDQNGNLVPNGVYFYRIDHGSDEPLYGKIMVLM